MPDATQYYYMGPHPQTMFIWFKLRIFGILRFQKVCADKQHKQKNWDFWKTVKFRAKIFFVPFGCTYLFWDNMAYIIQKFINCRRFFGHCSFFNKKYFRSYRFQKCSEKIWIFLKIWRFGWKSFVFCKINNLVENPLFFDVWKRLFLRYAHTDIHKKPYIHY